MSPKRFIRLFFSTALLGFALAAPMPAHAAEPVFAVMPIVFEGDLTPAAKSICTQRLALGLKATGATVKDGPGVAKLVPADGCDAVCRRTIAGALKTQYIVGATVKGEDRFYELKLWLADAASGKASVQLKRTCHVCSLTALARSMDLAASALRAKVKEEQVVPGEVSVVTEPAGATLKVDGKPMGTAPTKLKLTPGEHEIVAEFEGHLAARKKVTVIGGSEETVTLNLIAASKAGGFDTRRILGWTSIGVGAAAIVAGVVLLVVDGEPSCDTRWPDEFCPERHSTLLPGAVLLGTGAALSALGGYLLLSDSSERVARHPSRRFALVPMRGGMSLSFGGTL